MAPWDHPRVCGKDLVRGNLHPNKLGSPPRMRERRKMTHVSIFLFRITPAYAGKTSELCGGATQTPDHPRVCGKDAMSTRLSRFGRGSPPRMRERHVMARNMEDAESGSPPRMRERLILDSRTQCQIRITPAYAGKTRRRGLGWSIE